MRLIDADEVQKIIDHIRTKYVDTYNRRNKVNQFFWDTIRYIEKKVRSIPTVEARPVVHGEWEEYPSPLHRRCSVCKMEYDKLTNQFKGNYCPNCGADMRGEKNG